MVNKQLLGRQHTLLQHRKRGQSLARRKRSQVGMRGSQSGAHSNLRLRRRWYPPGKSSEER